MSCYIWYCEGPAQSPTRCTKCNSPSINGQCTNFILFDVALYLPLHSKGLTAAERETNNHYLVRASHDLDQRRYYKKLLNDLLRRPAEIRTTHNNRKARGVRRKSAQSPPPCLNIERVSSLNVLAVIVNDRLSASDHCVQPVEVVQSSAVCLLCATHSRPGPTLRVTAGRFWSTILAKIQ